jgi:Lar family restriction alleviation protein
MSTACPFCGGEDIDVHIPRKRLRALNTYAFCKRCHAHGPLAAKSEEARRRWETRLDGNLTIPEIIQELGPVPESDPASMDVLNQAIAGLRRSLDDISDFTSIINTIGGKYAR